MIPKDAPTETLDDETYAERRLTDAMRRFGVADLADIKTRTYWVNKTVLPRVIERFVEEGRLIPVSLPETVGRQRPTWTTPEALELADSDATSRTALVSPFDPLVYDRPRTERIFGFSFGISSFQAFQNFVYVLCRLSVIEIVLIQTGKGILAGIQQFHCPRFFFLKNSQRKPHLSWPALAKTS